MLSHFAWQTKNFENCRIWGDSKIQLVYSASPSTLQHVKLYYLDKQPLRLHSRSYLLDFNLRTQYHQSNCKDFMSE